MLRSKCMMIGTFIGVGMAVLAGAEDRVDRTPASNQVPHAPADGDVTAVNPPAFVWVPADGVDAYVVEYSTDPGFAPAETTVVEDVAISVYTPTETLEPGDWYWRYGVDDGDGERVYSRARAFTIPADAQAFPRITIDDALARIPDERPRAYFTPERVEEIRAEADGRYAEITQPVIQSAEAVLEMDEPLFPEPQPPEDPDEVRQAYVDGYRAMRPYTRRMHTCALAYIYTGDERFAEEAKRRLLHFASWDVDGPTSIHGVSGTRWYGEFGMDIGAHAPRTFDWIHDTLTEEEREKCLDAFSRRIAQMSQRHRNMPFESRPYSSHPGRQIGFVVEGGIVFAHDVPEASEWLDYTLRLLWSVYPAWGGPDGAWHEGVSYWRGYIRRMTDIAGELDRLGIPWKEKPFVRNTGYFGLYASYPHRPTRAFGDGHEGSVGSGAGQLMYILGSFFDNPYFRWHAEETGAGRPEGPMALYVYRPDLEAKPPADLPHAQVFPSSGWVAMHSDMAEPENNVVMLFKSNPRGSVSHDHANQNAFVLEAYTEPLAISSGYRQIHGSDHHLEWMQQTKAHNSILVDGEGQVPRSHESRGFIAAFDNTDEFAYTIGDATEAYDGRLDRFERHVLFSRPDYFVIIDDLEAPEPATYQWLLHAREEMEMDPDAREVLSVKNEARLRVRFLTPEALSFSQTDEFDTPPVDPAPTQHHFTASTEEPRASQRFVTVLMPHREGGQDALPEARMLEAEGGLALEVGDEVILWRESDADEVRWDDAASTARITVYRHEDGELQEVFHSAGDSVNPAEMPM